MIVNVQATEENDGQIDLAILEKAALAALIHESAEENSELSIMVEGDEEIQALNNEFLGHNTPTDVLSFPADELDPDTGNRYLGDIAISMPRAQSQASSGGHPVENEVQLLVVHGVLHLLGLDHAEPQGKEIMWAKQQAILDELGVRLSRLPED